MPLQFLRKDTLEEASGLRLVELVETRLLERIGLNLHDPGRAVRLVLVAMRDENSVLGLPEKERERVECARRPHPGEFVGPVVDLGPEVLLIERPDSAVGTIGHDNEVGVPLSRETGIDLGLEPHLDAKRASALL